MQTKTQPNGSLATLPGNRVGFRWRGEGSRGGGGVEARGGGKGEGDQNPAGVLWQHVMCQHGSVQNTLEPPRHKGIQWIFNKVRLMLNYLSPCWAGLLISSTQSFVRVPASNSLSFASTNYTPTHTNDLNLSVWQIIKLRSHNHQLRGKTGPECSSNMIFNSSFSSSLFSVALVTRLP